MERTSSMKLIRLAIITGLVVISSACSFNAKVITPEPASATESPSTFVPSTTTITDLPISSDTPIPAIAFTPTIIITPPPVNSDTIPIRFAPNGTYLDLVDSIPMGASKTYSVRALQGQLMSVSVDQSLDGDWVYVPMQVAGEDGTVLCPDDPNMECEFWRGVLPSTQEYFITLMPAAEVPGFTLRVAIDPPGTASQSFQYVSPQQDARFMYQDDFAPARFPGPIVGRVDSEVALQLIDSSFYDKTNLIEAYLMFGSSDDGDLVTNCTQPVNFGGGEQVTGKVMVNSHEFVRTEGAGVGAGNAYVHTAYRAVVNGACYEMIFYYHYGNIGNYDQSLGIKEFDDNALTKKFEAILATFTIQ